jgi:hypothetical protein
MFLNPCTGYLCIRSHTAGHKLEFSHGQALGKPAAQTSCYKRAALSMSAGSAQHRSCICRVISSPGKSGYFATEKGGGTGCIAGAHGSPLGNFMGTNGRGDEAGFCVSSEIDWRPK